MSQPDDADRSPEPMRDVVTPPERAARFRAAGWWTDDTLASRVNRHAEERPRAMAVIDELGAGRHSYAELRRDAAAVARGLAGCGVRAGDVVSLQLPNRYPAVVAAVAIQALGAVVNPLLPNYRARELAHVL